MAKVNKPFVMQFISRNDPFPYWSILEQRRQCVTCIAINIYLKTNENDYKTMLKLPKNKKNNYTCIQTGCSFDDYLPNLPATL